MQNINLTKISRYMVSQFIVMHIILQCALVYIYTYLQLCQQLNRCFHIQRKVNPLQILIQTTTLFNSLQDITGTMRI